MGGQACVFYGAAEFSRDTDLALLASSTNLDRFRAALAHLGAERIALPPFEIEFWLRELRSPALLIEAAALHPARSREIGTHRIALACAVDGDTDGVEAALAEEERLDRSADRRYWEPRRAELERLRHNRS